MSHKTPRGAKRCRRRRRRGGTGLAALKDGLRILSGSFCPHYDSESLRRPRYEELVGTGTLPDGFAADDGVGILFEGRRLVEAVASLPGQHAYRVERRFVAPVAPAFSRRTSLFAFQTLIN